MKYILTILIFLSLQIHAQKQLSWSFEFCIYTAIYDSSRYTEQELKNTLKLIMYTGITASATAFSLENFRKLNTEKLHEEYMEFKQYLNNLDIVSDKFWVEFKAAKLNEIEQIYHAKRITILSYNNPEILLLNYTNQKSEHFAKVLNKTPDNMKSDWRKLVEELKLTNGYPEGLEKEYQEKLNSPEWKEYMVMTLTTFGWWNSINEGIEYVNIWEPNAVEEYKKLFVKIIEENCDTP